MSATDEQQGQIAEAWLERLRQSGLRLDRQGRWWHEGQLVEHPRLTRALHRWLDRLEDGRYVIRIDESTFAYVDVEDAPYLVRSLWLEGEGPSTRVRISLSDESEEELSYGTLGVGEDGALYCKVKGGRFDARFERSAHFRLGERLEQQGDRFVLRAAGGTFVVGER
jgi:hypothetical protein